jgi:hypothetical protein
MPNIVFIEPKNRKTVVLKAGWHKINGLLVYTKQDVDVEYAEELRYPDYETKYPPLQHDPNMTLGKGRFSKFKD